MKIATKGRWLWTRTIGSTIVGQGLDTAVFITIAYIGRFGLSFIAITILTHWLLKTGYETAATPFTYAVVNFLKKKEAIDTFDYETNFNPGCFNTRYAAFLNQHKVRVIRWSLAKKVEANPCSPVMKMAGSDQSIPTIITRSD
ncbi:unnamed protein product [marine sediment metagenome]|uniref:Uncharacterized protein n=1 Tax=marine sediment metagenome TaxID=412755 RepID=X1EGC3_9ZZZZ